ncbi:MAG: tetraacyldisaccharide 4'-kinase [Rickettsiales bacterium]|nr:tetraacyldisaccharide 4'-kinase [Rickettsiales bacterium]
MIKTPKFWLKQNLISYLLLPLSFIYFLVFCVAKYSSKRTKISKSVICIGNIIAGGSGKTPTAIAIGTILQEMDVDFSYLSRGYKRKGKKSSIYLKKGRKVDTKTSGDEPALLSEYGDVFVSKDKLITLKEIDKSNKYQVVVLDDGLQNNVIFSDLRIVVIDGVIGFGNSFLLPAGPLRETISSGLKKADLIIVIGSANEGLLNYIPKDKLIGAKINISNLKEFQDEKLIAFCGIAYPNKFYSLLRQNKLDVVKEVSFVDHHRYNDIDLHNLLTLAKKQKAKLITTKKDWVKFSKKYQNKIGFLDIELEFDNKEKIIQEIKKLL